MEALDTLITYLCDLPVWLGLPISVILSLAVGAAACKIPVLLYDIFTTK